MVRSVFLMGAAAPGFAIIFATVKGVVHDPQHRPVPGADVTLKAEQSEWTQRAVTDADGAFQIAAVPVGDYTVTVALTGFNTVRQAVSVISDTTPVLHFQLELGALT